jgi:hypothetical protein
MAVLFIDMPDLMNSYISMFPLPLAIAIRHAHEVLIHVIEQQSSDQMRVTITDIVPQLIAEELPVFTNLLKTLSEGDYSNLKPLLEPFEERSQLCDAILSLLPSHLRMHWHCGWRHRLRTLILTSGMLQCHLRSYKHSGV